jgi:DNA repair exonuclease SbcCD nuclease subunit
LHGQVAGYNSNEKAEVISIPKLKEKNVDYLALGHIHSYAEGVIDNRGKYAYSGCLEGRGFDETGEKGFVLIEVVDKKANYEFVKVSTRNLIEVEFDVSEYPTYISAREDIINKLNEKCDKNDLIKLVVKGEVSPDFNFDKIGLNLVLNERFFFAKIKDKTTLKINLEDYAHDKSVRGEFVRAVFDSNLSDEQKNSVIACGLNAFKGEDF